MADETCGRRAVRASGSMAGLRLRGISSHGAIRRSLCDGAIAWCEASAAASAAGRQRQYYRAAPVGRVLRVQRRRRWHGRCRRAVGIATQVEVSTGAHREAESLPDPDAEQESIRPSARPGPLQQPSAAAPAPRRRLLLRQARRARQLYLRAGGGRRPRRRDGRVRYARGRAARWHQLDGKRPPHGAEDDGAGGELARWLTTSFTRSDFVVLKMDVEGAEASIIPALVDANATRLIDVFLWECHTSKLPRKPLYKRWPQHSKRTPCALLERVLTEHGVSIVYLEPYDFQHNSTGRWSDG